MKGEAKVPRKHGFLRGFKDNFIKTSTSMNTKHPAFTSFEILSFLHELVTSAKKKLTLSLSHFFAFSNLDNEMTL